MNRYKKISRDLVKYSFFSGLLLGFLIAFPNFFLEKEQLLSVVYSLGVLIFIITLNIFFIRNYAFKVTTLDYRETFSVSFLIFFVCVFINYTTFHLIHEQESFNFTGILSSAVLTAPISFLLAIFFKKEN